MVITKLAERSEAIGSFFATFFAFISQLAVEWNGKGRE